MLKLHHYEHNDNYLALKLTLPTREKNQHTKCGSKNIYALNPPTGKEQRTLNTWGF
jgi:hypothetical protein